MVFQAWFDESGKGQPPVYLLAGYVAKKETWESFADDWYAELNREPVLPYLHANESQLFKGFTSDERVGRVLKFVEIIGAHHLEAVAFALNHADYSAFFRFIERHPIITRIEQRMLKNPYYVSFQRVLTIMLARQASGGPRLGYLNQ